MLDAVGQTCGSCIEELVGNELLAQRSAIDTVPFVETFETIKICEGESAVIFGQPISDEGTYSETYTALNGCDSIHSITLDIANDLVVAFQDSLSIGLGESVTLNPIVPPGANLSYIWTEDPTLSCFDCANPFASPINTTTYPPEDRFAAINLPKHYLCDIKPKSLLNENQELNACCRFMDRMYFIIHHFQSLRKTLNRTYSQ